MNEVYGLFMESNKAKAISDLITIKTIEIMFDEYVIKFYHSAQSIPTITGKYFPVKLY